MYFLRKSPLPLPLTPALPPQCLCTSSVSMCPDKQEDMNPSVFSRLPNELIYHILNISILSDLYGQTCLSLCLVASWTRDLALPYLYSTIVLGDTTRPFVHNNDSSEWQFCPKECQSLVRNVWCRRRSSVCILVTTNLCPWVENISIDVFDFWNVLYSINYGAELTDEDQGLTETSCTPRSLHFHPNPDSTRFAHISNISPDSFSDRFWNHFAAVFLGKITSLVLPTVNYRDVGGFVQRLPCLTHLAVPYAQVNDSQLSEIRPLLDLPSLQMLVLAVAPDGCQGLVESWVSTIRRTDPRIHLVPYETDVDAARVQWIADVRGGGSVWERALRYTEDWEMARLGSMVLHL